MSARTLLLAPAALVSASLALAQQAPPGAPIVVEGTRNSDTQIRSFIKDLTPSYTRETLGRFVSNVCPRAFGLANGQNEVVEARIRRVAAAAGLHVAKTGCIVNLALFIVPDKAAFLKELQRWPFMYPEDWGNSRIHALQRDPSPVAAWQTSQIVWQDGIPLSARDTAAPDPHAGFFPHAIGTRLKPSAHPSFNKAVLVIQANAVSGLTPVQVADYAAMRTLVRIDSKQIPTSGQQTILTALDAPMGTPVPETLTAWDLSFLKAFYASRKDNYVETQRGEMTRLMKRDLDAQRRDKN